MKIGDLPFSPAEPQQLFKDLPLGQAFFFKSTDGRDSGTEAGVVCMKITEDLMTEPAFAINLASGEPAWVLDTDMVTPIDAIVIDWRAV